MISRRALLHGLTLAGLGSTFAESEAAAPTSQVTARFRQAVVAWCFKGILPPEEFFAACAAMGITAVEGLPADQYEAAQQAGLKISMVTPHSFKEGPVDAKEYQLYVDKLQQGIDRAKEVGAENLIFFSGFRKEGLKDEEMRENCVRVWQEVAPYAEERGVRMVLEQLNTRDDSHPMKGHPGYFADDIDLAAEMVQEVNSPNVKLLFDVYHVSIMNGDIIRRIEQYAEIIGHIHTAGNPGRGPLDKHQEIYYPAVFDALERINFKGYVSHEFLPTQDRATALKELQHAVSLCHNS